MSNFNLERFRSEILSGNGLARNNRFEILITPPPGMAGGTGSSSKSELVSLYVDQANIPMFNIFTKSFKVFGPSYQRPISAEYGGEGLSIIFHVDRGMHVRRFFEDWMHLIINPNRFTVNYQEKYVTDILIRQLDEMNRIRYEVKLIEAFPRNLNLMDLNNSASNQTHRLSVLFAYRYWKNTLKESGRIDIPKAITNPQVPSYDVELPESGKRWIQRSDSLNETPGFYLPPTA